MFRWLRSRCQPSRENWILLEFRQSSENATTIDILAHPCFVLKLRWAFKFRKTGEFNLCMWWYVIIACGWVWGWQWWRCLRRWQWRRRRWWSTLRWRVWVPGRRKFRLGWSANGNPDCSDQWSVMIIVIKMVIHLEKGDKTGDKEDGGDDITWVFCWGKHFDDDGDL